MGYLRVFLPYIVRLGPAWFRRKILDMIPSPRLQRVKYITDTVHDGCRKLLAEKKAALAKDERALRIWKKAGADVPKE